MEKLQAFLSRKNTRGALFTLLFLLAAIFSLMIVWAVTETPLSEGFSHLTQDPWGVVTLVDLYLGLLFFIAFIFLTETSWMRAALWSVCVFFLGNVVSIFYIIHLMRRGFSFPPIEK